MHKELVEYMRENEIPIGMLWKKSAEEQMIFVRDHIAHFLMGRERNCYVVGLHTSKSIELPVYSICSNGITVVMRNNFLGWVVSLQSVHPMDIPNDLYYYHDGEEEGLSHGDCEGFKERWVYGKYSKGCKECTIRVRNIYHLYTLLYLLKSNNNANI